MAAQSAARRSPEAPQVIVLFGATGDLAARKLLPGFYHLAEVGLMPEDYRLIGSSPVELTEETFLAHAKNVIEQFGSSPLTDEGWSSFRSKLSYVPSSAEHMEALAAKVAEGHAALGEESHSLYYLSIPPLAMDAMVTALGAAKMNGPEARVVLEKPFGTDRASAVALNDAAPHRLRGAPDLPDRPLPREGGRPERPRRPLLERALRADVVRRAPRADRDRRP